MNGDDIHPLKEEKWFSVPDFICAERDYFEKDQEDM